MSNVINLFGQSTKIDTAEQDESAQSFDFNDTIKANEAKQARMLKARRKDNANVRRKYKLK